MLLRLSKHGRLRKMGSSSSKSTSDSRELVLYDNKKAREAVQHTKSDFVKAKSLVNCLVPGDMIQVKGNSLYQWFYSHFAIFIGNGEVVHVQPRPGYRKGQGGKQVILRETMDKAFGDSKLVRKNNHLDNTPQFNALIRRPHEIVLAARRRVGEFWDYNMFSHNCEHFATWCRYGREVSLQSSGFGDVATGKITFMEFIEHSVKSLKEKFVTFTKWVKRKAIGLIDSIK